MGSGEEGEDLKMQPVGMYFTMSDIDIIALAHWARTTDDIPAQAIPGNDAQPDYGLWLTGFNKTVQDYKKNWQRSTTREYYTENRERPDVCQRYART